MLSSRLKKHLEFRLGPWLNYTLSCGFYWNRSLNRFVLANPYSTYSCRFVGCYNMIGLIIFLLVILFLHYHKPFVMEDVNDADSKSNNRNGNPDLFTSIIIVYIFAATCILLFSTVAQQHWSELCEFYNNVYIVDAKFKKVFSNLSTDVPPLIGLLEKNVTVSVYITLLLPLAIAIMTLHEISPIYLIFHDVFEINFKSYASWQFFFVLFILSYGCLVWINAINSLCCTLALFILVSLGWLSKAVPKVTSFSTNIVKTEGIGLVHVTSVIHVYRTLHLLSTLANVILAKFRIGIHLIYTSLVVCISVVILIRFDSSLLTQEDDNITVTCIFLGTAFSIILLAIAIIRCECMMSDELNNVWKICKSRLTQFNGRNKEVRKIAKSLYPIRVYTTYPLVLVDKGMFMDWCNTTLNNIVSCLVGF